MIFFMQIKLSTKYVDPYTIWKRIGKVYYELELPPELAVVHPVFYISLLKYCVGDPTPIVTLEIVSMKYNLTYEDVLLETLDRHV